MGEMGRRGLRDPDPSIVARLRGVCKGATLAVDGHAPDHARAPR